MTPPAKPHSTAVACPPDVGTTDTDPMRGRRLRRFLPLLLLIATALILLWAGVLDLLAPQALLDRANAWLTFAALNPWLTFAALTAAIVAATALGLPGAVALFAISGFLIGMPLTLVAVTVGNVLGTAILYQAIRSAFYRPNQATELDAGLLAWFRRRFRRNPLAFAVFLRALPITPNGMNTALLAALRCPWPTFLASSALGPLPNGFLLSWLGMQLADEARAGRLPDASTLTDPRWWLPLVLIALLALAPLLLKRRKRIIATNSGSGC